MGTRTVPVRGCHGALGVIRKIVRRLLRRRGRGTGTGEAGAEEEGWEEVNTGDLPAYWPAIASEMTVSGVRVQCRDQFSTDHPFASDISYRH